MFLACMCKKRSNLRISTKKVDLKIKIKIEKLNFLIKIYFYFRFLLFLNKIKKKINNLKIYLSQI